MPCLQVVILRTFPPVKALLCEEVPGGGDGTLGCDIPARAQVGLDYYGSFRMQEFFGTDAVVFTPESWLDVESDPGRLQKVSAGSETAFRRGRGQCPGKMVAPMELNKAFVAVRTSLTGPIIRRAVSDFGAKDNGSGLCTSYVGPN